MKGKAGVARSSVTSSCSSERDCGPASDIPVYCIAQGRMLTVAGGG